MEEVSAEKAGASGSSAKADEQAIHLPCKVQKVTNKNKKGLKKSRIRRILQPGHFSYCINNTGVYSC